MIFRHTHTHRQSGILLSHKKSEIMPFTATWMDLEITILSEVNQRKTNIIWYHLYVEFKNNDTKELIYKTEMTHRENKQTFGYQGDTVSFLKLFVLSLICVCVYTIWCSFLFFLSFKYYWAFFCHSAGYL